MNHLSAVPIFGGATTRLSAVGALGTLGLPCPTTCGVGWRRGAQFARHGRGVPSCVSRRRSEPPRDLRSQTRSARRHSGRVLARWPTSIPGVRFGELVPLLADQMHRARFSAR